jgi:hypothetical protein
VVDERRNSIRLSWSWVQLPSRTYRKHSVLTSIPASSWGTLTPSRRLLFETAIFSTLIIVTTVTGARDQHNRHLRPAPCTMALVSNFESGTWIQRLHA